MGMTDHGSEDEGQATGSGQPAPRVLSRTEATKTGAAEPTTSARLLSIMQAERAEWEHLLTQVGEARMTEPGVEGQWSVKDIVAHLTWYDRIVVEGAQAVMRGEPLVRTGLRALEMDERNERIAAESRHRPLRDVLADSRQVFDQVLAVVRACPDDVLNDGRRFGLPDDVPPWVLVANNTYEHYREHGRAIRAWLDRQSDTQ
jgi:hypothetical protein